MAQVFAKLFQSKKFQCSNSGTRSQSKSIWHVSSFTKEDINLVLLKNNCDKVILDSRCKRKVTIEDLLCEKCLVKFKRQCRRSVIGRDRCSKCPGIGGDVSDRPKYKDVCGGNKKDKLVREMIFGACPLASTGSTTIKVHSLKSPHQLMLSCVFQFRGCKDETQKTDFDSLDSFENEIFGDGLPRRSSENNLSSMGSHSSGPMDMPYRDGYWGSDTSLNLSESSGSYYPLPASSPGAHSSASINSTSHLSKLRRMRRSFNNSLQYTSLQSRDASSLPSSSGDSDRAGPPVRRRSARLGMAVLFNLDEFDDSRREFEAFFFSHFTLIEGHLLSLKAAVERSPCEVNVDDYIMEALEDFRQKIYDLYAAPRLSQPVWLGMMASTTQRSRLCEKFVKQLSVLIDRYDTKSTNYFVSTLLTGVLMYHLAWVPTVTPSGETHASYADKHSAKWLDMLAKTHPYNPLWAQLSDLYGAIGMPPRLARTIVTGKKVDTIVKFLTVLSYFIRCSEIHETLDECYDEENMLSQIESAVDEICLESMEKEVASDFVVVDAPNNSTFTHDVDGGSDSGLVSQYTNQSKTSKATRPRYIGINNTTSGTSESGFTEPDSRSFAEVKRVPSSSPADKVREWINTSQLDEGPAVYEPQILLSNPHTELRRSNSELHRSTTDSTLVSSSCLSPQTPSQVHCASPSTVIQCAPDPVEARREEIAHAGRAAVISPELSDSQGSRDLVKSSDSDKTTSTFNRKNLVRLFSEECDEFDPLFDGRPPSLKRQMSGLSSVSQFDELFEDDDLDSFSAILSPNQQKQVGEVPETPTPTGGRNMLFKVMKHAGFSSQQSPQGAEAIDNNMKQPLTRENSSASQAVTPSAADEGYRPRNLSTGKASSRCSTPQTVKEMTPGGDPRSRHMSACPTILSDEAEEIDPFQGFDEMTMPRSTNVSKLADPAISTTSFGRQQLGGFSEHYLSDFVLHGTSDDDVLSKVQKDLVASVEHSVLEDRISEAVCVVADTERWTINVCSSMREMPKQIGPSDLVKNMVEATNTLCKLNMSPELILIHMEDRLQEMFFKSRMLSEYVRNTKNVDMDELNAMFGMAITDIKFLLSVSSTHSTVNVKGLY